MLPRVTLENGVTVANLMLPYPVEFDDGSVLGPVSPSYAKLILPEYERTKHPGIKGTTDVEFTPVIKADALSLLQEAEKDETIDIIIVPWLLLDAMKTAGMPIGKVRSVYLADEQRQVCRSDYYCR